MSRWRNDSSANEREMSLVGHLDELRSRLFICLVGLAITTIAAFFITPPVLKGMMMPARHLEVEPGVKQELTFRVGNDGVVRLKDAAQADTLDKLSTKRLRVEFDAKPGQALMIGSEAHQQFYYHSILDPFIIRLKVSILIGIVLALPVLLSQIWGFIKPGLTLKERGMIKPLLSGALVLFPIGAGFAYLMLRLLVEVSMKYSIEGLAPLLDFYKYLSLLTTMMLMFGVIFELPLVVALAARVGLVTPEFLGRYRRHAYVILTFASMILTPADPFSMIFMLVPLVLLYELSMLLARPMALLHARDLQVKVQEDPIG